MSHPLFFWNKCFLFLHKAISRNFLFLTEGIIDLQQGLLHVCYCKSIVTTSCFVYSKVLKIKDSVISKKTCSDEEQSTSLAFIHKDGFFTHPQRCTAVSCPQERKYLEKPCSLKTRSAGFKLHRSTPVLLQSMPFLLVCPLQ